MASVTGPLPEPRRALQTPRQPLHLLSQSGDWYIRAKANVDFVSALTLLVLTAPLLAVGILLMRLTSPGPVIFAQTRLGRGGEPFTLYKIRTMTHNCESLTGPRWSVPGDTRVTAVGRWLRRTHIDELPQLWNVLRGEMSMVGPRPERPEFVPQLEQALPYYTARLQVLPGVTGLAQVQLPPDTNLDSVRIKLAYDLHYVRSISLLLDVRICWATFFKMFGVSFSLLRWLFGFPAREAVDRDYIALLDIENASLNGHATHDGAPAAALDPCSTGLS